MGLARSWGWQLRGALARLQIDLAEKRVGDFRDLIVVGRFSNVDADAGQDRAGLHTGLSKMGHQRRREWAVRAVTISSNAIRLGCEGDKLALYLGDSG
jgi:hypothetical protein